MKKTSCVMGMVKKGMNETCYRFFSTLANPTRLAALENLMNKPMNVTQLAEALGQEQSMVSHNLRSLVKCRFVHVERKAGENEMSSFSSGGAGESFPRGDREGSHLVVIYLGEDPDDVIVREETELDVRELMSRLDSGGSVFVTMKADGIEDEVCEGC